MKVLFLFGFFCVVLVVASAAPNKKHHTKRDGDQSVGQLETGIEVDAPPKTHKKHHNVHKRIHLKRDASSGSNDTSTAVSANQTDSNPNPFEPILLLINEFITDSLEVSPSSDGDKRKRTGHKRARHTKRDHGDGGSSEEKSTKDGKDEKDGKDDQSDQYDTEQVLELLDIIIKFLEDQYSKTSDGDNGSKESKSCSN